MARTMRRPSAAQEEVLAIFLENPESLLTEREVVTKLNLDTKHGRGKVNHHLRSLLEKGKIAQERPRGAYHLVRDEKLLSRLLRAFDEKVADEDELLSRLRPRPKPDDFQSALEQLAALRWIEPHPSGHYGAYTTVLTIGSDEPFRRSGPWWRLTALGASVDKRCHLCAKPWDDAPLVAADAWGTRFAVGTRDDPPRLPPRDMVAVHAHCHTRNQERSILDDSPTLCAVCALPLVPRPPQWRQVRLADVRHALAEEDWNYARRLASACLRDLRVQIPDDEPAREAEALAWNEVALRALSESQDATTKCARLRLYRTLTRPLWPRSAIATIVEILHTRPGSTAEVDQLVDEAHRIREQHSREEREAWLRLVGPAGIIHSASPTHWMGAAEERRHPQAPELADARPQTFAYYTPEGWKHPLCAESRSSELPRKKGSEGT